eukprot:scaffold25259_cov142-Isochrysis_galbana.AAC.2
MITARTSKVGMVVAAPCCPLSRLPCEWLGHTILLLTAIHNSTPPPPPLTTTSTSVASSMRAGQLRRERELMWR